MSDSEDVHAMLRGLTFPPYAKADGSEALALVHRDLWCPDCGAQLPIPDECRECPLWRHRNKAFTLTCVVCQHVSTGVFFV